MMSPACRSHSIGLQNEVAMIWSNNNSCTGGLIDFLLAANPDRHLIERRIIYLKWRRKTYLITAIRTVSLLITNPGERYTLGTCILVTSIETQCIGSITICKVYYNTYHFSQDQSFGVQWWRNFRLLFPWPRGTCLNLLLVLRCMITRSYPFIWQRWITYDIIKGVYNLFISAVVLTTNTTL